MSSQLDREDRQRQFPAYLLSAFLAAISFWHGT